MIGIISLLILSGCGSGEEEQITKLRFVAIPAEEQGDQILYMTPIADYISEKTGIEVELIVATDYNAAIEAIKYGHAEIAWLGPFAYILATELTDIDPMVGGVRTDGRFFYNSIIFTREDTDLESIEDLKKYSDIITFSFNDPASASGYLIPLYQLKNMSIDPEKDFKEISYAGSHAASQLAVYNGHVMAGASNLPTYNKMVENGEIDPEIQKIIWTSDPIPPSTIVVRSDLDPILKAEIKNAFLTINANVGDVQGVGNKKFEEFREVTDADYNVLRDIARELGLDLSKAD